MKPIPQEWIKKYVDQLIGVAKELPEGSVMQKALIIRASAVMDMVAAFKESPDPPRDAMQVSIAAQIEGGGSQRVD